MGRQPGPWRVCRFAGETNFRVVFSWNKRQFKPSTGTDDETEAHRRAPGIYSSVVSGNAPARKVRAQSGGARPFEEVGRGWLAEVGPALDDRTRATYRDVYVLGHLHGFFGTLEAVTTEAVKQYIAERLKVVKAGTVRKELSVLRQIVQWALGESAPTIPRVPKRALGTTAYARTTTELSRAEIQALIEQLPERALKRHGAWPIRARFVVAYETSLRPSTLDAMAVPTHYVKGDTTLRITDEIDKARFGRELVLSDAARAALDSVAPDEGLVFGRHDYRDALEAAAARCVEAGRLPKHKAETIHPYDFRHAHGMHFAEGGNIPALQWGMGHKTLEATMRYVRASQRAHEAEMRRLGRIAPGQLSHGIESQESDVPQSPAQGSDDSKTP